MLVKTTVVWCPAERTEEEPATVPKASLDAHRNAFAASKTLTALLLPFDDRMRTCRPDVRANTPKLSVRSIQHANRTTTRRQKEGSIASIE